MTSFAPSFASSWFQMWIRPRATVRSLITNKATAGAILLSLASGVLQSLVTGATNYAGAPYGRVGVLAIAFPIGVSWGLLQLHLIAGLLYQVANWTGMPVRFRELRIAIGWSNLPMSAGFGLWLLSTLFMGASLYLDPEAVALSDPLAGLLIGLIYLSTTLCVVWWWVLLVLAVAEVHHISAWRALGHLVTAGFVLMSAVAVGFAVVALLFWR